MDESIYQIPCPLNDEHCAELERLITQIPQVLSIVQDCEDCEVQIPGLADSLNRSLRLAKALKAIADKHRGR